MLKPGTVAGGSRVRIAGARADNGVNERYEVVRRGRPAAPQPAAARLNARRIHGAGGTPRGERVNRPENMAEVKLMPYGISLYGTIVQMNEQSVIVRLLTVPRAAELVQQGTEAEIVCTHEGRVTSAAACVLGTRGDDLALAIQRAQAGSSQRRATPRVECEVPVQYRAIRSDGRTGAWLDGTVCDLSVGGLGIVLPARAEVPKRLEVLFLLPNEHSHGRGITRTYADDGSVILQAADDDRPIRAVARTAHARTLPDGRTRVGICFITMAPADKQRLVRFSAETEQPAADAA